MDSLYYYTARDMQGAFVRGTLQASTRSSALADLRVRALFVTSLEPAASPRGAISAVLQFGGASHKSVLAFFRCLCALVRAGVPLRRSLDVTIEQCSDSLLREALRALACDIEGGLALSAAMARRPKIFGRVYVALIKAGELGGALDEVLERVAAMLERESALRKRVGAALAYPAIVACTAVGLIVFLLSSIVPMFRSMYEQLHVPLPPITSALLEAGALLHAPFVWLSFGAAAAAAAALLSARPARGGSPVAESVLFAIPIAGVLAKKAATARFARMLGTLLRSGVGVVPALDVVADAVSSVRFRSSIAAVRQSLDEGTPLSEPLAASGLYEPLFLQMVQVGEETGSLDAMLLRAADYYDLDVETMLGAIGSLLEPAMIVLLGGAVGFIVAAVFIPLYTLIGTMK